VEKIEKLTASKARNAVLRKERVLLAKKIKVRRFLKWVRDDMRIKKLRKELYGTSH